MAAQPPSDEPCSICHDSFTLPCQANCSHWFCGKCIIGIWHHGCGFEPSKCPLCRRHVTLLTLAESSHLQQHKTTSEVSRVVGEIHTYNRTFGEPSTTLLQKLKDLPFLVRRLLHDLVEIIPENRLEYHLLVQSSGHHS